MQRDTRHSFIPFEVGERGVDLRNLPEATEQPCLQLSSEISPARFALLSFGGKKILLPRGGGGEALQGVVGSPLSVTDSGSRGLLRLKKHGTIAGGTGRRKKEKGKREEIIPQPVNQRKGKKREPNSFPPLTCTRCQKERN